MPVQVEGEQSFVTPAWKLSRLSDFAGGLITAVPSEQLEANQSPLMENVVVRGGELKVDTGYQGVAEDPLVADTVQAVLGVPKKFIEHVATDGTRELLCITDLAWFRFVGAPGAWELIPGLAADNTTLNGPYPGGISLMLVVDETSFSVGDTVGVVNDTGDQFFTTVALVNPGVLTLTSNPASGFGASSGNTVTRGYLGKLSGDANNQVVAVAIPGTSDIVATNGQDEPMKYNGTRVSVLGGLSTIAVTVVCKTLSLFANHLILGNMTLAGVLNPFTIYWSDTGNVELWTGGNSGFENLYDTRDHIIAMEVLGNDHIIYRSRSIVRQELVGTTAKLFNFRTMLYGVSTSRGIGAVSPNSVYNVGRFHLFLSRDGIYKYQGGFGADPITGAVFHGFFDADRGIFNKEIAHRAFVHFIEELDEFLAFLPRQDKTYPDTILRINLQDSTWSHRVLGHEMACADSSIADAEPAIKDLIGDIIEQEWTMFSKSVSNEIPVMMLGGSNLKPYKYDFISPNDDGTNIPWFYITKNFLSLGLTQRYDRFDFYMRGNDILIHYSIDNGQSWVSLGTHSPGALDQVVRKFAQFVTDSIIFRFKGDGGGFALRELGIKVRDESRWNL